MKKNAFLLACAFAIQITAQAQLKHDYVWTMGYGQIAPSSQGYPFGGVILDFGIAPPSLTLVDYPFFEPHAAISDKEGNLVAYTNGCRIANSNHTGMLNGDTLNPGVVFEAFCTHPSYATYPLWQPCVFLPKPGSDSLYYLFHIRDDDELWNPMELLYSVVDATGAGGDGAVISKNNAVLSDSVFLKGYVMATRHANGRDWWVVVPRRFSNNVHVARLDPEGVEYTGMQNFDTLDLGIDSIYSASQTAFSADGSKYFHNSRKKLLVYDFDRCTGILSNPQGLHWDTLPFGGGGVATSPNSRFLYLTSSTTVQQYDLWAPDLAASMQVVAVYDGFHAPFPATFFQMMPGPDGKIYIITGHSNNVLHVIHNPNEPGLACKVEQHAITLPARQSFFINNFANYNLGPIDGSPCDTLEIDNHPIARFKWAVEGLLSPQHIKFADYSYHAPNTWFWDFGDGNTSQETNPLHQYAAPGIYNVCLTACNANACDTACEEIEIEAVNTVTIASDWGSVLLWPNPAVDHFFLKPPDGVRIGAEVLDLMGRKMASAFTTQEGGFRFDVGALPKGVYLVSVWREGEPGRAVRKLVIR